jgi:hypothetical protein
MQKNLGRMLRMALWIPVFAALFGPVSDRAAGVHTVYYTFLRVCTSLSDSAFEAALLHRLHGP